jgi:hypothetical protein
MRGAVPDQLIALSGYPDLNLTYRVEVTAEGEGFRIAVHLDKPLPAALVGKAGWYENEYVVDAATTFILLANAAESVSH